MPRSWSEAVKACPKHPVRGKNGRWCACRVGWRYRMGLPDPITGVTSRPKWSETFPTKEIADGHQRDTRKAIAEHTFTRSRGESVADCLDAFLDRKRKAGRKIKTVSGYCDIIENHLKPHLGKHPLDRLSVDNVQGMLDKIATGPSLRRGKGAETPVTAGTLVNIRACLRAALNDAVRQRKITINVATLVELPPVHRRPPSVLEDARLTKFVAYIKGEQLEGAMHVAAIYGPRRGEVAGLQRDDIDWTNKLILIRHTLLDEDGDWPCAWCGAGVTHKRLLFDTPKSAAGVRAYPLVPEVAATLKKVLAQQKKDRLLYGPSYRDHDLVFAKPDGMPWRPDWISREFKRLLQASGAAAGLKTIPSLKSTRSTMATNLHREGVPIEVVGGVTGHTKGSDVTRDHYLLVTAEQTRKEFGRVAARAGGKKARSTGSRRSDRQSDQTQKTAASPK